MCGIAGILSGAGRTVDLGELAGMSKALTHRGPDSEGVCGWSPGQAVTHAAVASRLPVSKAAFAHRRLAIIDTGSGGHQPMATADGRFVITYNGEIYNYLELRAELEQSGVTFATQSDTEVLLQAIAAWGVEATLPRLTGMFAFAVLDTKDRKVTLARDPFGIKPLIWTMRDGDLIFASEPNPLLALSGVGRRVHPQALYDYLRFGLTDRGDRTLFDGIKHLPPGHFAVVDAESPAAPKPVRYWAAGTAPETKISFEDAAGELRRLFLQSVRLHLRADVPVGAALSGGIDSSAVVLAMRELEGDGLDLHTFSFTAPGEPMDEEAWADMAGRAAKAQMHKTTATGDQLAAGLDRLIELQGEPFGSTSIFAQHQVYRLVRRQGIKVTVDGQGADELIAGYVPFLAARAASLIGRGRLTAAWRLVRASSDQTSAAGLLARAARFLLPEGLQAAGRWCAGEQLVPPWMERSWVDAAGVDARAPQRPARGDVLKSELNASLTDRVIPSLLRYQDRNSMAHSIESRVPFLTPQLADFVYSLPEDFLIGENGETKRVFRRAMRGLVPDAILDRRDKIGFITPQDTWLKEGGPWLMETLLSDRARSIPAFAAAPFRRTAEIALGGKGPLKPEVWRWANLIRWAEIFDAEFAA